MKIKRQGGFTLIEVIVVAGIIAILAGILVPMIFKEIDESKKTRAAGDVRSISSAMFVFKKDTGDWPIKDDSCNSTVTLLYGTGTEPSNLAGVGYDTTVKLSYNGRLATDENGCWPTTWKGPYIALVTADPWGHTYITNANGFSVANSPVWILSAGPDGLLDTAPSSTALGGDDIGLRLK